MSEFVLTNKLGGWFARSLDNYIQRHRQNHPQVVYARTLTQARVICFGPKNERQRRLAARFQEKRP